MKHNVSKNTIRHLSEQTTGSVDNDVCPPSNKFFIKKIELRYATLIAQTELDMMRNSNNGITHKHERQKAEYKSQLSKLKQILSKIPSGFSLGQTMYTRISKEQNQKIAAEFSNYVRPRFLMHLAENQSNSLRELGLCEHSINRMKSGLAPADKNRAFYNLTVDHIIERSGSGELGYNKDYDKKTTKYMKPTYKVNHFANLILIPDSIHNGIKNAINKTQNLPSSELGQSQWYTTLIPTNNNKSNVYKSNKQKDYQKFIHKNNRRIDTEIRQIFYLSEQLNVEIELFIDRSKQKNKSLANNFNTSEQANYIYKSRIIPTLQEMVDTIETIEQRLGQKKENSNSTNNLTSELSRILNNTFMSNLDKNIKRAEKVIGYEFAKNFRQKRNRLIEKYSKNNKQVTNNKTYKR